jgi:hypothetical protein
MCIGMGWRSVPVPHRTLKRPPVVKSRTTPRRLGGLGALETSLCPHTVLCNAQAQRVSWSRARQARGHQASAERWPQDRWIASIPDLLRCVP